jgi:V8-like Glu-specific endopeptidase
MPSFLLLVLSLTISFNVFSGDTENVIYGIDNRLDLFESNNALYLKLANSTAAMIENTSLDVSKDVVTIEGPTLESEGVCSDARFAKQQTAATCSGFLVGKDLLLTAGHCIENMNDCEQYSWVFDYSNIIKELNIFKINKKHIYRCVKIISRSLNSKTQNDYALIQLDRQSERSPLPIRKNSKISNTAKLVVIGHPSGLPTKISDGALIRSNKNKYYFQANLDTFGGNSGSAVLDSETGIVEGILVRGEHDYVMDSVSNCHRPKICKMNECRGEDVTRITNIKELQ